MREDQCDQHSWGTGRRLRSGCVGTGWVRHELSAPAQASPRIVKTKARLRHMKMNHHIRSCCREHETICSGLLSWGGPDRPSMDQVLCISLSRLLLSKYCVRYNLDCSSDICLG